MRGRLTCLLIAAATRCGASYYATTSCARSSPHRWRCGPVRSQQSSSGNPAPPIGLRTLNEDEIRDKLNAVPVFAVSNAAEELVGTPDPESGELVGTFYLELSEAQEALQSLRVVKPGATLRLSVVTLGTAFALSEWQELVDEDAPQPLISADVAALFSDDDDDEFDDDSAYDTDTADAAFLSDLEGDVRSGSGREALGDDRSGTSDPAVRLQADQREAAAVSEVLSQSPAPPLLRRRNTKEGSIPIFGSDLLKFEPPPPEIGEEAAAREGKPSQMTPLFFRREDFRRAWAASGGSEDELPPIQLTDLRTLCHQMKYDTTQDYRPMLLVAPESSIAFVQRHEAALAAAGASGKPDDLPREDEVTVSEELKRLLEGE